MTRIGIIIGIVFAVLLSWYARESTWIARATAIFFGLCASAFLPAFFGTLFCRWVTKPAAVCSMVVGFVVPAFWLLFIKAQESSAIGLCNAIFGTADKPVNSLLQGSPNWPVVDPIVVGLPVSLIVIIIVSIFTKRPPKEHLDRCFGAK